MKYPASHLSKLEEIESIVAKWPTEKDFNHVLKWVMQFDNMDIDLALRIIKNLNVVGYEDLNNALAIAYSKLERMAVDKKTKINNRNTLFAGIGDGAKSGAMIGYNFRVINDLPEDNFMGDESVKYLEAGIIDNIVLVDDIVGTGHQATKEIQSLTEKVTPFGVKNIFLLTAVGMKEGIDKISEETKAYVFSAFEYCEHDTAKSLDSRFYEGIAHEERDSLKRRLEYYGLIASNSGMGYGGIGALIAFYYNTPNISLPVIWGNRNSWIPLFKRATKINGINSYFKQIDDSLSKKKKASETIPGEKNEFLLFVEGKNDEVFFDYFLNIITEEIQYEKVTVVSIGGYNSKTLIDNITRLSPHYLFVLEKDENYPKQYIDKVTKMFEGRNHIWVHPLEYYFETDLILKDESWNRYFPSLREQTDSDNRRVRRSFSLDFVQFLKRTTRLTEFFDRFIDGKKFDELKKHLLDAIAAKPPVVVPEVPEDV